MSGFFTIKLGETKITLHHHVHLLSLAAVEEAHSFLWFCDFFRSPSLICLKTTTFFISQRLLFNCFVKIG